MRVVVAFLVWLFNFWTWKDLLLRWVHWRPPSPPASGETAREEHVPSQEGQLQDSELSRFLSSLPQDECGCTKVDIGEDSEFTAPVTISFGRRSFQLLHGTDWHSGYREFLKAVSSSKVVFREGLKVELWGEESCKRLEAFGDALRQSDNDLRKLDIECRRGSAIPFSKCVSSVVLGNDNIQDLRLDFQYLKGSGAGSETMGKVEAAEFVAHIASPYNLRILKSFKLYATLVDEEGLEQLIKPFKSPHSLLEDFGFDSLTSDVQLEHISGMLDTSTSLKILLIYSRETLYQYQDSLEKVFTRGYASLATALCSNQSLKTLKCTMYSSVELKALLDPLLPKNNNVQCNTTLTKLQLFGNIGGEEGIESLVEMLQTNSSLLKLVFHVLDELHADHPKGIENILTILKALKINKSLKKLVSVPIVQQSEVTKCLEL